MFAPPGKTHMLVQYVILATGAVLLGYLLGRLDSLAQRMRNLEKPGRAESGPVSRAAAARRAGFVSVQPSSRV
jgi:hypothetical protein